MWILKKKFSTFWQNLNFKKQFFGYNIQGQNHIKNNFLNRNKKVNTRSVCLLEEYEKSKATNAINDWREFNFDLIREISLLDLNVRIDSIEENDCFKEFTHLEIFSL